MVQMKWKQIIKREAKIESWFSEVYCLWQQQNKVEDLTMNKHGGRGGMKQNLQHWDVHSKWARHQEKTILERLQIIEGKRDNLDPNTLKLVDTAELKT